MKKIIAGIVVVLLAIGFFVSASYINSINGKIFAQMSQDTAYYSVEDANYTKGLLNSKGSFIATLNDLPYSFKVNVDFSNNFFASNNAIVYILNENEDLKGIFPNEEIFKILVSAKGGDININAKINDINFTRNDTNLVLSNTSFKITGSEEFVKNMELNLGYVLLEQLSHKEKLEAKNIKISEFPLEKLSFNDIFSPSRNSEQNISIDSANFISSIAFDFDKLKIFAKTVQNAQNDYDSVLKLDLAKFNLANENFMLNNINLDMNFNNLSKKAYDSLVQNSNTDIFSMMLLASQFLKANPQIILNNLSFEKESKKFDANGQTIFTENNIKSQFHANTEILPSQIWPDFANFDAYFVDNNGSYVLDFIYDDSNKSDVTTIINGERLIIDPQ
ncbi:YdgA family protein [Campylobacter lari]|uniref:YdgA family protein n=1 Tax=Campylobacter lari TaxID=201 RepID=UPI00214A4BA4|nr:YdgA family protein [Campylobacter lari]MCR2075349.1 YdgA family protein [Campylobacter lari subsp. concheus]MCR2082935.1 YdgA family protein [Campylobacter lari subsp. concheus]MCR2084888.1 YdgA family protein [Campylobacter lari subsp. concheus]